MRAFTFVSLFITLATPASAVPVSDREKRQSGEYDYVIVGASAPMTSLNPQEQPIGYTKLGTGAYICIGRYSWFGCCKPPLRRQQYPSRRY
jgi:hypothetical protein